MWLNSINKIHAFIRKFRKDKQDHYRTFIQLTDSFLKSLFQVNSGEKLSLGKWPGKKLTLYMYIDYSTSVTETKQKYSQEELGCSSSPQTVIVDTQFCADDLLQTSNGRQLTYMVDIAAENNSVNDQ